MNRIPKNIFVLIFANMSNPLESFKAKIWVMVMVTNRKIPSDSKENIPTDEDIIKNQKVKPAVVANALNLEEESSIFRLDKWMQLNQIVPVLLHQLIRLKETK